MSSLNKPTAGAREERDLPVGSHPIQLYSMGMIKSYKSELSSATPNGQKITIALEELGAKYDAYTINIMKGETTFQ